MSSPRTIRIAAAILERADGMTLLVRKRGTTAFMQPGGKIEAGEAPVKALCRELAEELALAIDPARPRYLGRYVAPAANEAGATVEAEIFRVEVTGPVEAAAEIEEIVWVDPNLPLALVLAPLTRDHVLPLLMAGAAR
jgi:8-oxo-dGTP diphosphatase